MSPFALPWGRIDVNFCLDSGTGNILEGGQLPPLATPLPTLTVFKITSTGTGNT